MNNETHLTGSRSEGHEPINQQPSPDTPAIIPRMALPTEFQELLQQMEIESLYDRLQPLVENMSEIMQALQETVDSGCLISLRNNAHSSAGKVSRVASERISKALGEFAAQTETPEAQSVLMDYAAQVMDNHLECLASGMKATDHFASFQFVAPIMEGLATENTNLAQGSDILERTAEYAISYGRCPSELMTAPSDLIFIGSLREECHISSNSLWRYLMQREQLPKEIQLSMAQHANHLLLLHLCVRPDVDEETIQQIRCKLA